MTERHTNGSSDDGTRPSPLDASSSGLASRDYRPRTGGPELVTSWPLGPAPGADGPGDADWSVETGKYVTLQRSRFTLPYLGGHDDVPLYLNVVGHVSVETGATLSLWLTQRHLDGDHYETEVDLTRTGDLQTPMVEVAPDDPDAIRDGREVYGGFTLRARVEDGTATVDRGTAVQLFSE
ncbi:hypothetical protein [Haloarcula pelagica]|uniref:hypothetical protein n=1 Tax=Haloarcula pelagica TaxID=3033389 RepID=UPI0024C29D28|nr:hypothetical protein [Halomicroarcula sp. YJ-61-S]